MKALAPFYRGISIVLRKKLDVSINKHLGYEEEPVNASRSIYRGTDKLDALTWRPIHRKITDVVNDMD